MNDTKHPNQRDDRREFHDPLYVPEARYRNDRNFRSLVDLMHHLIQKAEYTPTEVREAALLACVHHDYYTVRHQYLDPNQFNLSDIHAKPADTKTK